MTGVFGDAFAAQIPDAGIKIKRPGLYLLERPDQISLLDDPNRNIRPPGVRVLALACRTGEAWNEAASLHSAFDQKLNQALATADVEQRRVLMADVEKNLQDSGIPIQRCWRKLYNHSSPKLNNFRMHSTQEDDFDMVWLDEKDFSSSVPACSFEHARDRFCSCLPGTVRRWGPSALTYARADQEQELAAWRGAGCTPFVLCCGARPGSIRTPVVKADCHEHWLFRAGTYVGGGALWP